MDVKDLLSGIAVVIDDRIDAGAGGDGENEDDDRIAEIVRRLEQEWDLPCYTTSVMPPEGMWPGLLRAASFILLDWKRWPSGAAELEQHGIQENIRFLKQAKDYFAPVFIFTKEDTEDVKAELPASIYSEETAGKSFVFIQRKKELLSDDALNLEAVERWMRGNASVYALKAWNRAFLAAKQELFGSMYDRSADWPKVFWKAYEDDGVDPGSSLTHLINDNLRGRMRTGSFEAEVFADQGPDVSKEDLRALIAEVSFQPNEVIPEDEIRCGDLFRPSERKFLLNIRPDCDCIPRRGQVIDRVELYCLEGEKMDDDELKEAYLKEYGHFEERVWESIAFAACGGDSGRFSFRKLRLKRFAEVKNKRIGRILHPYLTRIQQRYVLFLQRQGAPRIPEGAVPAPMPSRAADAPDAETIGR